MYETNQSHTFIMTSSGDASQAVSDSAFKTYTQSYNSPQEKATSHLQRDLNVRLASAYNMYLAMVT